MFKLFEHFQLCIFKNLIRKQIVLPNLVTMDIFGVSDMNFREKNLDYWSNVYGFKMSCMRPFVLKDAQIIIIKEDNVFTDIKKFKNIDCCKCQVDELTDFRAKFKLTAKKSTKLTGLGVSFDTFFNHDYLKNKVF